MSGDNVTGQGGSRQSANVMPGSLEAIAAQLAAGYGPQDYSSYLNGIYANQMTTPGGGAADPSKAKEAATKAVEPMMQAMQGGGKLWNRVAGRMGDAMAGADFGSMFGGGQFPMGMFGGQMPEGWPADWQSQMQNNMPENFDWSQFFNRGG